MRWLPIRTVGGLEGTYRHGPCSHWALPAGTGPVAAWGMGIHGIPGLVLGWPCIVQFMRLGESWTGLDWEYLAQPGSWLGRHTSLFWRRVHDLYKQGRVIQRG